MTTSVVNAALSVSALICSDVFDLSKTYFLNTGIAGVNPKKSTIGSVALPRFAIQVDTQMGFVYWLRTFRSGFGGFLSQVH